MSVQQHILLVLQMQEWVLAASCSSTVSFTYAQGPGCALPSGCVAWCVTAILLQTSQ